MFFWQIYCNTIWASLIGRAIDNDDVATWWCVHVVDGEALSKNAESLWTFCQKKLTLMTNEVGRGPFRKCVNSKSFEALVWLLRSLKCFVDVSHAATLLEWILFSETQWERQRSQRRSNSEPSPKSCRLNPRSCNPRSCNPKSCRLNPRSCKSTCHNRKTSPNVVLNQF